jgi:hypothetical protein
MPSENVPPGQPTRPSDLNPNSEQFWKSRGFPNRPDDWQTRDPKTPPNNGRTDVKK